MSYQQSSEEVGVYIFNHSVMSNIYCIVLKLALGNWVFMQKELIKRPSFMLHLNTNPLAIASTKKQVLN